MEIVKINTKLTREEREAVLRYGELDKVWTIDTTIMKFYNKAKRQGWKQLVEYVYEDGSVCGGIFEAPDRAVTIRNAEKKLMSEAQMENLQSEEC